MCNKKGKEFSSKETMDQFLCRLCDKVVTFGDKHSCFLHKSDDIVNVRQEHDDKGNPWIDTEIDNIPANLKGNLERLFSNSQRNVTEDTESVRTGLDESNKKSSSQNESKKKMYLKGFFDKLSHKKRQENYSYKLLSGSLLNASTSVIHLKENQTAKHRKSSESYESAHRSQNDIRGASRRKSKPTKIVYEKEEGIEKDCIASKPGFKKTIEAKTGESQDLTDNSVSVEETTNTTRFSNTSVAVPINSFENTNSIAGSSGIKVSLQRDPETGKIICNECGKKFKCKSQFDNHYRFHSGEKPFVCELCNKRYTQKSVLNRHFKIHTGEKPFVCDVCKKEFMRKEHFDKHYKIHTGEKPHECDVCRKKFIQKWDLNRHYKTHTGVKPLVWNNCEISFLRKDKFLSHYEMHKDEVP